MHKRIFASLLLSIIIAFSLNAQQPFVCDGTFYTSFIPDNQYYSRIYQVDFDPVSSNVVFTDLSGSLGIELNAIGYRVTDNLIYGVDPYEHILYQVGKNGIVNNLGMMDLNQNALYFSGDVTPNGRQLALIGASNTFASGYAFEVAVVDLNNYNVSIRTLSITDMFITDVAFNPFNGLLYAVDTDQRRIATIDIETGNVNVLISNITSQVETLASLFFDSFGNLYGYGDTGSIDGFFTINLQTGSIILQEQGIDVTYNDGCSCPYTVEVLQRVDKEETVVCDEILMTLVVSNATGETRTGIEIIEQLPIGYNIAEILYNPFVGNITSSVGSNLLHIENMQIPLGIDSILFRVDFDATAVPDDYSLQADLSGLPAALGVSTVSDNPMTSVQNDPNNFRLKLEDFSTNFKLLPTCFGQGDSVVIDASSYTGTFTWDDGSNAKKRVFYNTGVHELVITDDCLRTILDYEITEIAFEQEILNTQITLCNNQDTTLISDISVANYNWSTGSIASSIVVNNDGLYQLTMTDYCIEWQHDYQVNSQQLQILNTPISYVLEKGESLNIQLDIFSSTNLEYNIIWSAEDMSNLSCIDCVDQTITTLKDGYYTATIMNDSGCSDIYTFYINVLPLKVKVFWPNIFSPNGDGVNDSFFPFSDLDNGMILKFEIFNRWGANVFRKENQVVNDPGAGWDGKFKGDYVHPAVFAFYAEIQFYDEVKLFEGSISVVR